MLVMGWVGLLVFGHGQNWFLAALVTGTLHNQTYSLAWALVGLAYSLLASFMWLRWARQLGRVRRVLGPFLLVALMLTGSLVVARRVMHSLGVIVVGVEWDPDSQEFVVFIPISPVVGELLRRGDLQTIVSIEGLWWSPSERKSPQPLLASEVEEFAVGAPALMGRRRGTRRLTGYAWVHGLEPIGNVRVPWMPGKGGADSAFVVRVNAALVNREGKRVGWEYTPQLTGSRVLESVRGATIPRTARSEAFLTEALDWLSDPDRNRAPFQVRPPPPPGVGRVDVRPSQK